MNIHRMTAGNKEKPDSRTIAHAHTAPVRGFIPAAVCVGLALVVMLSCASRWSMEHYHPILGEWKTERGVIMIIRSTPHRGVAASVLVSEGRDEAEIQIGDAVITDITPLADGGYSGVFVMPEGEKPIKVKLGLLSPDRLMIISWDRRLKSKTMDWRRYTEDSE